MAAYKAANEQEEAPSAASLPFSTQWIPPQPDFYNVNFDAPTFADLECIGIGVVSGEYFATLSQKVAIKFALDSSIWDVHLKSDARNVMSVLKKQGAKFSIVGEIIESTQNQLNLCCSYVLSWTCPYCNLVADCLAKYVKRLMML